MTDTTPSPDPIDHPAAKTAASGAAHQPTPADPARPAGARWWNRRVPLLLTAAGLLLGCFLGAGVVAIGAFAFGEGHRGDAGISQDRGERGDHAGRGARDGRDERPGQPAPTAPATSVPTAPTTAAPAPSAT